MDAGEVITGDTSWLHQTLTFNGNGTLSGSYYNSISTAKWEFASNNTWLKVTSTDTGLSYGQVNYLQIINLSSSALTLKDTVGGINWFMYTKL